MSENHPEGELVPGRTHSDEGSAKRVATAVYILQSLGFFVGFTFLIGLVVNYIYRSEARGTWVDSHFRWQMRTFWFGLMWFFLAIMFVAGVALLTFGLGAPLAYLIFFVLIAIQVVWLIYRVVRGWKRLVEGREMYANRPRHQARQSHIPPRP